MKITIKKLTKKYGEKTVLDIDELMIEKGKITGIIGPNGCGKTSLMNIISGERYKMVPKEIKYDDKGLNRNIIERMSYVFQKPYLFKRSVYDNIAYPLKLRNIKSKEKDILVSNIIKKFEIENLSENRANLLSGGETQKVALARGLVFGPELLLLDEPTSNIDPDSIKIIEREIVNFNRETKATIVIVTHNMEQSKRLCENIFDMNY